MTHFCASSPDFSQSSLGLESIHFSTLLKQITVKCYFLPKCGTLGNSSTVHKENNLTKKILVQEPLLLTKQLGRRGGQFYEREDGRS